MSSFIHKTGSVFSHMFEVFYDDGTPYTLPASEFSCQLNNFKGEKIASLVIQDTEIGHIKLLTFPDTTAWPIGLLKLDIRYPNAGEVTETFTIQIQGSETPRS